jgi:hypothetical protein
MLASVLWPVKDTPSGIFLSNSALGSLALFLKMAHLILYLSLGTLPSFGRPSSSISILNLLRLRTFLLQIFANDLDATIFDKSDHHSISKHFARLLLPISPTVA